jgi:hypothetical protein
MEGMQPSAVSQLLAALRERMRAVEAIDPTTLSESQLRSLFSDTARMFSAIAARPESSSGVHGMPFGALPFVPPLLASPALALPSTSADLRDPRFSTPRTLESRRAARSEPEEDDTPLPSDLLALVLSLLEAEDLGRFQRVSRHWSKVVKNEVVPKRFQLLADLGTRGSFKLHRREKFSPKLLAQVEDDYQRLPGLLDAIDPRASYYETNLLGEIHKEVFYLRMGLIFQKVADVRQVADQDRFCRMWRHELLKRISSAEPPPEELVDYADHVVAALASVDPNVRSFETQTALELMAQLPSDGSATEIDNHVELLALFLQGNMYPYAIRVLAKASPQAIASGGDELKSKIAAIAGSPTATRDVRKGAQDILKKLPA